MYKNIVNKYAVLIIAAISPGLSLLLVTPRSLANDSMHPCSIYPDIRMQDNLNKNKNGNIGRGESDCRVRENDDVCRGGKVPKGAEVPEDFCRLQDLGLNIK